MFMFSFYVMGVRQKREGWAVCPLFFQKKRTFLPNRLKALDKFFKKKRNTVDFGPIVINKMKRMKELRP